MTAFTPIVGTLGYLWNRDSDQVLLVRRDARPDDDHYGKVNGLGGKVEADESIVECLRRELNEEAGIELTSFQLRGTVTWTNFGPKRQQWLAFIFIIDGWNGVAPDRNQEGSLLWVDRSRLLAACRLDSDTGSGRGPDDSVELPMWAGDRHFVPLVFDDDPRTFHGTMPYDGSQPISWTYERI